MAHPLNMLAYYVHDLDPHVFQLNQTGVTFVRVALAVGFVLSWAVIVARMFRKSRQEGVLGLTGIYAVKWTWEKGDPVAGAALYAWGLSLVGLFAAFYFNMVGWGPRWYGLAYLAGFLVAYLLIKKNSRDGMLRLNPERVPDLVLNCCIFGVLVGGRLGYCLFYDLPNSLERGHTPLLWDFSGPFPSWGVLRVWDGGMSAHGGVVGTILTIFWFSWKYKSQGARWINIGDAACMVVPVGLFFGRVANFINGELYGHPTNVPWAVKFPSEIFSPTNNHILPSVEDKLPGLLVKLNLVDTVDPRLIDGKMMDRGLTALHDQVVAHDPTALNAVADILPARHPSQLYEAGLEGLLLFIICYTIGRKWRKDGMASGAFLTLYPVMRIISEQFRVGDTPRNFMGIELSYGVLYSLPMFLAGLIYWVYFIRKSKPNVWVPQAAAAPEEETKKPKPA